MSNLKENKKEQHTDMDELTTEMKEHICDDICKHPCNIKDIEKLEDVCAECKIDQFVRDILNLHIRKIINAAGGSSPEENKMNGNTNQVLLSEVKPGETINTGIGTFIVLEQTNKGTKVIKKDLFKKRQQFGSSPDYKGSHMQQLCEGEIYNAFAKEFGSENIVEHEVDLITVDMQQDYGKVNCKVRPITFDEARKYNALLVNKELGDWYWTITPWSTEERGWRWTLSVVAPAGNIFRNNYWNDNGVRPFCILKSNIFVSKGE